MTSFLELVFILTAILLAARLAGLDLHLSDLARSWRVSALSGWSGSGNGILQMPNTGILVVLPAARAYGLDRQAG